MIYWYEVWADDSLSPPYVLIVEPTPAGVRVVDPQENGRAVFASETYDAVKFWLLEDEYVRVTGRMTAEEDPEQS